MITIRSAIYIMGFGKSFIEGTIISLNYQFPGTPRSFELRLIISETAFIVKIIKLINII